QRFGALLGDDLFHRLPVDRLDVDRVGHFRIGHDRRRVAVDQHHPVTLLAQRLAGLRAGVVELAGLTDHDRAGADDQDGLDISALWHVSWPPSAQRNDRTREIRPAGPGWLPDGPGNRTPANRGSRCPDWNRRTASGG